MLKKVGVVAAAAIGLSMIAPAFASASPADQPDLGDLPGLVQEGSDPTFGDDCNPIILGGDALGYGAAALMAGVYAGIALTPALIVDAYEDCACD